MTINDSIPLYLHPTTHHTRPPHHHHKHHRHHPALVPPSPLTVTHTLSGGGGSGGKKPADEVGAGGGGGWELSGSNGLVFQTDVLFPTNNVNVLHGEEVEEVAVDSDDNHHHHHPRVVQSHPSLPRVEDTDPYYPPGSGSNPYPSYPELDTPHPYPAVDVNPYQPNYPGVNNYHPGDWWGDWGNGSLQLNMTVWGEGVGAGAGGGVAGGEGVEADRVNWGILLLAPLVVFGIAGNTLVILAISLERRLQNVTNYFLLSLAVTDLLVSLIVMPFSIINELTGRWLFGLILCNLFVTADVLMCTSSILHLCTISLERYIGIRYPLWAKNKSKRTVFYKIVLVWTLALAITSPITVLGILDDANILQQGQCLLANQHFIIYGSIFAFFIPLTIMVVMYALTVSMLNERAKLCAGAGDGEPGGGGGSHPQGQMAIRRSTSRKQWQRQTRHTVVGAHGSSYRKETLAPAKSYPGSAGEGGGSGGGRHFKPRYQPLTKRNTLPRYHERDADDFEYCNGDGDDHGSEDTIENGSAISKWRRIARKQNGQKSPPDGGEPTRLKDMVQKHHVAMKAANILLLRKDLVRKETSSVQTEQRASKVLGVVFMIFVICWAPFFLVNILTVLCTTCYFPPPSSPSSCGWATSPARSTPSSTRCSTRSSSSPSSNCSAADTPISTEASVGATTTVVTVTACGFFSPRRLVSWLVTAMRDPPLTGI
ncbi:hypothetical protein ACOMHN_040422 [Nucella lapillus]